MNNIFVINLEHRTDRLEQAKKYLDEHELEWERFDAIKYDTKVHGFEKEFNNFKKIVYHASPSYASGCFGCVLSHYNVIKIAKERKYDMVTILEDDFYFTPGWKENLDKCLYDLKDKDWDMFYLSANNICPAIPITNNIEKPRKCFTTGAYILKSSLFDYILENALEYGKEIDVFYCETVQQKFNVYTPKKNIIRQSPSYSDIQNCHVNYDFF
jgi:GR25 family glycosyltransferase involved in LPS biosynthesis